MAPSASYWRTMSMAPAFVRGSPRPLYLVGLVDYWNKQVAL